MSDRPTRRSLRTTRRFRATSRRARGEQPTTPRRPPSGPSRPRVPRSSAPARHAVRNTMSSLSGRGRESNLDRPARRRSSPSAISTSATSVAGAAPSHSSRFVPIDARLRTGPGTANTSTPRSAASRAVIRLPPRSRLSTTTSTSTSAARMRLRNGNRKASGAVPGGHSETTAPRSATISHRSRCCDG